MPKRDASRKLRQSDRSRGCAELCCVAVGWKNYYGSRSEWGTRVAARFYSLIESAKLAGREPRLPPGGDPLRIRNSGTVTLARDLK